MLTTKETQGFHDSSVGKESTCNKKMASPKCPLPHPRNLQDVSSYTLKKKKKDLEGTSLGGPVVKTSPFNAGDAGLIPGQGAKIPHASWRKNQNIKQKQFCNIVNKHLKKKKSTKKIPQKSGNKQILRIRLRLCKVVCYWNIRIKLWAVRVLINLIFFSLLTDSTYPDFSLK